LKFKERDKSRPQRAYVFKRLKGDFLAADGLAALLFGLTQQTFMTKSALDNVADHAAGLDGRLFRAFVIVQAACLLVEGQLAVAGTSHASGLTRVINLSLSSKRKRDNRATTVYSYIQKSRAGDPLQN
jgi:hypothetical protein